MNTHKKPNLDIKIKTLLILLVIMLTGVYSFNFSGNNLYSNPNSDIIDDDKDNDFDSIKLPNLSAIGEDSWWSDSFYYRKLINITNIEPTTLYNFTTSIVFNYDNLVNEGKMQADLDDIRIVENGTIRKYYVKKDYNNTKPQNNVATVYFKTTVFGSSSHNNAYLYYGNSTVGKAQGYYLGTNFGLMSRWDLEDGVGSSTAGDSIQDNDGTLISMDPDNDWVSGQINELALDFDGNNDYVRVDDDPSLTVTTGLTISFWANRHTSDAWELAVGNGGGWRQNGYHVMGSSSRRYRFEIQNLTDDSKEILDTASTVPNNEWHMITATYDGAYLTFYIDDNQDISGHITALSSEGRNDVTYIGDSGNNLHIGWHSYGPNYFDGALDDVRIYNYELTSEEVEWLYNNYELETKLNEEQAKKAGAKVIAKDVNGIPIPNANITLINKTNVANPNIDSKITDSEGSVIFEDLEIGYYNFSVYLESNMIDYNILVNETSEPYLLQGLYREIILECNVGTNVFNIIDIDGAPLESGWIEVGNITDGFGQIQKCLMNETGQALFQWLYDEYPYNYTVYYQDINYNPQIVKLADGILNNPNVPEPVFVNFTTINFSVYILDGSKTVSGAKISLNRDDHPGISIVNLTTDENGKATLRWFNSSGLELGEIINYSMKLYFFDEAKDFNKTNNIADRVPEFNFTVSSTINYEFRFSITLTDFTTEIQLLSPDSIDALWGSELKIRSLFNITKAGDPNVYPIGPTYAEIMSYRVIRQSITIISGTMDIEQSNMGRHQATINTDSLEGGKSYSIEISAQKSGFTIPLPRTIVLTVLKNDILLNQSEDDDSVTSVYWLESATMSVKPYGENSESFMIEDEIFVQEDNGDYNFEFSIPNLDTDWNLTELMFNIDDITFDDDEANINLMITDVDYSTQYTWTYDNRENGTYYYAPLDPGNGSWSNLLIDMNRGSLRPDNGFNFRITGTFVGTVDITTIATFTRNKINVEYVKQNVTEAIIIPSDGNGWAIQNITFELNDCYNPNTWIKVNPANVIENITIEGYVFDYIYDAGEGYGTININNTIIYTVDNQFSFNIGNKSDIVFNVVIKVEYIQDIYKNDHLEVFNLTMVQQEYYEDDDFILYPNEFNWIDQGAKLTISDINNGTHYFSPSEVGMNIIIDGKTYYFGGYGNLELDSVSSYTKNVPLLATIQSDRLLNFTLFYSVNYLRTVSYAITGVIEYEIRESPDVYGIVPYNPTLEHYNQTIDTSLINSGSYTVRFTATKEHYSEGIIDLNLIVEERITLLNGNSRDPTNIIANIYVKDSVNFTFTFWDRDLDLLIEDLDIKSWSWWIGNTEQESGNLDFDAQNNYYVFDFDTETRAVGTYSITIKISKDNYQSKLASITLVISLRTMDYDLGDEFDDKIASVVKGKIITLSIELTDPTQGDIPIKGAKVVLEIGDDELEFDEKDDGVYELEFDTKDYEAFFTSNTLTGTIKITREDYEKEEVDITIVVEMEEVVEGVPTFYFLMVVSAIAAIVGSLATYRYIQVARIPTFVKKARKAKKSIKSGDKISEALLYPSKEEFIVKTLGAKYDALGLSLEDLLGLKGKGKTEDSLKKNGGVK